MPSPRSDKERAQRREAARRHRAAVKARKALETSPLMPEPVPPVITDEVPVLVHQDEAQLVASTPVPAMPVQPVVSSTPGKVPPPPRYVPRRIVENAPLSPADLQAVSLFSAHWLQEPRTYNAQLEACGANEAARYALWCAALREAEACVPLLRQQYKVACVGVDGPQSQEATKVKENLDWAEALLAQRG